MKRTVAILAFPDGPAAGSPTSAARRMLAKIERIGRYKRNPRTAEYMRALAKTALPGAEIIEVEGTLPVGRLADADSVVLLWADAIGYGWMTIEHAVFAAKRRYARVSALNGRRRSIELSSTTLLACRARRAAERLWLGEVVIASALVLTAPFLVVWDFLRGRR